MSLTATHALLTGAGGGRKAASQGPSGGAVTPGEGRQGGRRNADFDRLLLHQPNQLRPSGQLGDAATVFNSQASAPQLSNPCASSSTLRGPVARWHAQCTPSAVPAILAVLGSATLPATGSDSFSDSLWYAGCLCKGHCRRLYRVVCERGLTKALSTVGRFLKSPERGS